MLWMSLQCEFATKQGKIFVGEIKQIYKGGQSMHLLQLASVLLFVGPRCKEFVIGYFDSIQAEITFKLRLYFVVNNTE